MNAVVRRLRPWERVGLGLEILWTYALVRLTMRRHDLRAAVAWLRTHCGLPWPATHNLDDQRLASATVRTITKLPTDSRCLMRSLVLLTVLARRGVSCTLVVGVRSEGGFAAHAWIEHRDRELLNSGSGEFQRLMEV